MTDKAFSKAASVLWRSIADKHTRRVISPGEAKLVASGALKQTDFPLRYGPLPIKREEFLSWLRDRSEGKGGCVWKCEYTGNLVQFLAKTQAGRLTIDHRVPLAKGGTSTLNNLVVCSMEANMVKRDLTEERYNALMYFLKGWPVEDRESVLIRLKGWEPVYRRKRG